MIEEVVEEGLSGEKETETAQEQLQGDIPLGEYGESIDIANLLLFLASEESHFLTGSQ